MQIAQFLIRDSLVYFEADFVQTQQPYLSSSLFVCIFPYFYPKKKEKTFIFIGYWKNWIIQFYFQLFKGKKMFILHLVNHQSFITRLLYNPTNRNNRISTCVGHLLPWAYKRKGTTDTHLYNIVHYIFPDLVIGRH